MIANSVHVALNSRVCMSQFLIVAREFVQMCFVDVFASGLVEELDNWKKICQKAYTLDKADFIDSRYPISSALVPTSSNKRKLRSSQDSPLKTIQNPRFSDSHE